MATEKATHTTATQNPAPKKPKAPARARATRAKISTAATADLTTAITAPAAAPRKSRARANSTEKVTPLIEGGAEIERALLDQEAAKSLSPNAVSKPACKAQCGQCGREMRFVPFALSNLMCRSCYGLDRYRRPSAPSSSSLTAPRPGGSR